MAIWQDLVDNEGFRASYQIVQRFVRKLQIALSPEARVVIETAPGEEGQVDYGSGPMVRDPQTGKYRRTRLFVMTLGYSRKCVRFLVFRSSVQIWAELHEKAFRRLGGSTRIVILDNLRSFSQSAVPRSAPALWLGSNALPGERSRSERESRVGRRACPKDAVKKGSASKVWKKRKPTWISGRSAG